MPRSSAHSVPLSPETRDVLLKVIHRAEEPLTVAQLAKQMTGAFKATAAKLLPVLQELSAARVLHVFPPATARGTPRYWDRELHEYGRVRLLQSLGKKGPLSKVDLRKSIKELSDQQFQEAFDALVAERQVFPHPPLPRAKTVRYGSQPAAPAPYLKEVGEQLAKVVSLLLAADVSRSELTNAALDLLEQAGLPVESRCVQETGNNEINDAVDLIAVMQRIDAGAERGALVPVRDIRRAVSLDKPAFDLALLDLARQGRLTLHRHDYAMSLSESERDRKSVV